MVTIKVLIVDDSIFMRKLISDMIERDDDLQVVGMAKNGKEAIALAKELKPDVITMDIEMPEMDGLTALKQIMKQCPAPTIMVSSLTEKGAYETIKALQIGAVDFVQKPSGSISLDLYRVKEELIAKIKAVAHSRRNTVNKKVQIQSPKTFSDSGPIEEKRVTLNREVRNFNQIFAIGTSTGGPKALETVITSLPANFNSPILVVQHMPPKFTHFLAQRLNGISELNIVEAKHNERIIAGTVYIAPGGYHMEVSERMNVYRIQLTKQAPKNGHRPSVDVLFDSITQLKKIKRHYIIMTGMGNDGAQGLLKGKQAGGASTIAESEETCVVFGMPKSAIKLGGVDHIISLHRISSKMIKLSEEHSQCESIQRNE